MSLEGAVSPGRSTPPGESPPPAPLVGATGSPGLDAVADVVNDTAAPFQDLANPELGSAQHVAAGMSAALGVMGAVPDLVDTGFAVLTAPIAKLFPALPAMTLLGLHVGPPHTHTHPPSLVPPAPPVPLPSIGTLVGAGAVTVLIGGLPAARCGDIGVSVTCGSLAPPFEVYTGSSNVFIGGARAARLGDLTKHCNPSSAGKPGALDVIMTGAAIAAGGLEGNPGAIAQGVAEAAMLGVKAMMGKDPGLPMLPGALLGPPVPSVLIGGFPCPALGDMAMGKLLDGLKKPLRKRPKRSPGRERGEPLDGSSAAQREANGLKCNGSHPVYLVTGENFDSYLDHDSGGLFEWRRHYTSARGAQDGPLGHGWRHFYQRTLRRRLHRATFIDWDGLRTEFGRFERGETTTRADGYVLERLGMGHYALRRRGRPRLEFRGGEFADELPLTRVVSERGALELCHDGAGRLRALVETPREGPRRRFELELDTLGRILRVLEVDADPDAPRREIAAIAAYDYSRAGDLARARDSLGGIARYEYDGFHRLTRQSDARGYAYAYQYDASGRCTRALGQDGLWWCRIQYNPDERCTRYTEGDSATWEYHYDGAGVVTEIVDPYGGTLRRHLDELGRMAREVDSGGREIRWLYDPDGAHYARADRFGHLFLPERDQPVLPNPFARTLPSRSLGWLLAGAVEPAADALFGVDAAELAALPAELAPLVRGCFRTRGAGPAGAPRVERDGMGRVRLEVDAAGRRRLWRYDATGNLVGSVDREGRSSTRETSSWNLTGARVDALGNAVRYEYSRIEQITAITDPLGNTSRYDYDQKQRLSRVYRHGKLREEYVYDAGDHFIEKRDAQGNVLFTNSIHANHFVATRRLASGGEHRFDYDDRGRIIEASTDAHEIRIRFDVSGRRSADLRDGAGVEHERLGARVTTRALARFEHETTRAADAIVLAHGTAASTQIEYARPGLVTRRAANGTTELLQFDEEGRLEASLRYRRGRLGRIEGAAIRYSYGAEGDLLQIADSQRGTTQYEVDAAHRLVAEYTPDGRQHRYFLDPAGNLICCPGVEHIIIAPGNRLRRALDESFEYDGRNQLSERRRSNGASTRYRYDSFDMLVAIERTPPESERWPLSPRGEEPAAWSTWTAAYDALGRRLWTRWGEQRREFYWDGDRLAAETLPSGALRVYEYATSDALVPLAFSEYPSRDAEPRAGRTYHVFVNPVGMPLCIEDAQGHCVWFAARIDPYGRVEVADGSTLEYNLRWPGHYFDPETGLHYNRYRYYDPLLGRYLQSDPIGHGGSPVNLYAYCSNPLVQVDVLGLMHAGRTDAAQATHHDPTDVRGQESVDARALHSDDDHVLQELCRRKAERLRAALGESGHRSVTLSVGVLEAPGGQRRLFVTTSADEQMLPPEVERVAEAEGIDFEETPPTVMRTRSYDNDTWDPKGPDDARNNPQRKTDAILLEHDGSVVVPYIKSRRGKPVDGSLHHAEQRMEGYAGVSGERVRAQAPTRHCCGACQRKLGDNLDKIPEDLQRAPRRRGAPRRKRK